jgi:hypothetical protein
VKTIYTDKVGLYPWAMLLGAVLSFWRAYVILAEVRPAPFGLEKGLSVVVFAVIGGNFTFLAVKRFRDIRSAKHEGRDPTIIRMKNE